METLINYSEIEFETNYNFPITNICEQEYNLELVKQLQGIYPSLSSMNSFKNFDLLPTEEELVALNSLRVDLINEDEYESEGHQYSIDKYQYINYASMNRLYAEVKDYLNLLSSANEDISDKVAKFVNKLVGSVITAQESESAWVILRAYTPNHVPYLPRLHSDPCISEGYQPTVVSLKGASTLFYNASAEQREEFIKMKNTTLDETKLNAELYNIFEFSRAHYASSIISGTTFLCGGSENGALHTHPSVQQERIFLAILPGKESDIIRLKEKIQEAEKDFLGTVK